jgi:hypothetical protein
MEKANPRAQWRVSKLVPNQSDHTPVSQIDRENPFHFAKLRRGVDMVQESLLMTPDKVRQIGRQLNTERHNSKYPI